MSSCDICCDTLTNTVRKPVQCPYCDHVACLSCIKQFTLSTTNDPSCMNCKRQWTVEFFNSQVPRSWVDKTYKKHRENVLFEREIAMLPATQPIIEKQLKAEKIKQKLILLQEQKQDIIARMRHLNDDLYNIKLEITGAEITRGVKFVRACPKDDCKGFLSEHWKCGLCETKVCAKCHVIKRLKGEEKKDHTCTEADLETAKLLAKDSKPCPTCAALIFKIDGCDQMFCTQCHTAFSWKTGKVETENIHNPHYYEWVRQNNNGVVPRAEVNICNDNAALVPWHRFAPLIQDVKELGKIHRMVVHIREVDMVDYRDNVHFHNSNLALRIQYMRNEISAEKFKSMLQTREKTRDKKKNIHQILDLFYRVSRDVLNSIQVTTTRDEKLKTIQTIVQMAQYANDSFEKVQRRFKCMVPMIDVCNFTSVRKPVKEKEIKQQ